MTRHMKRELDKLKKQILYLCALVEDDIRKALRAVAEGDIALANEVVKNDDEIDLLEVEVEEECLKILALYQPVATDLRFIIAVLKINRDLERIGDFAVSTAGKVEHLSKSKSREILADVKAMAEKAITMLKMSIDALVNEDKVAAWEVTSLDIEVDTMKRENGRRIREYFRNRPDELESLLDYLGICRHLERVADHATNIAEDVIYMIEGEIVRHRTDEIAH